MKRIVKTSLLSLLLIPFLASCISGNTKDPTITRTETKVASDTLYVKKVENLSNDFIMGMDSSTVVSLENSGVKYYDFDDTEKDVFEILSKNGINTIRVRIWNDPYDKDGHGYGGGNCDINTAIAIGKRATKYNMYLMPSFHYSDFWADPSKQDCPKAWRELDFYEKSDALYNYTKDCLQKLKKEKIAVNVVSLGNETTGGKMAGETRFSFYSALVNQGSKAVREIYPTAKVAVHFTNPEKKEMMLESARQLESNKVDYDIYASSYYPYWHGTLDNLSETLSTISTTYNKEVMCMETSYCFVDYDTDFHANTISGTSGYDSKPYPFTIAGQANHVRNLIDTIANDTKNGIGICYWEGTWITVGTNSYEENSLLWEKYGSGWAASYAKEFDPKDAGKYYGGNPVDNQAFFDAQGKALESLKVFNLARFGNDAPIYVDGIEDAMISYYTYETFSLPDKVNVLFNNNEKSSVPVIWEDFDIEAAKAQGNGKHIIKGKAQTSSGEVDVNCILTILEKNFIDNFGFESGDIDPWVITNNSSSPFSNSDYQSSVSGSGNPQTGAYCYHFWAGEADTCNFDVEQTINLDTSGKYKFQISTMGGGKGTDAADPTQLNVYAYVKINGVITYQKAAPFTNYNAGYKSFLINDIVYNSGDTLTVGFHIESSEAGIWGDVDDCMLNFVE